MIAFLSGTVIEKSVENIVLCTDSGIGLEVFVPSTEMEKMPLQSKTSVHTYMQVKEDGMALYGFRDKDSLALFKLLITVNGIGPKGAMKLFGGISASDLRYAICAEDTKTLSKLPGLGAKSASKIVIELKDKLGQAGASTAMGIVSLPASSSIREDAKAALISLGYSATQSAQAVARVEAKEGETIDSVISAALRVL